MKSIGILVDNLGHSELSYLLCKNINNFLERYSGIDVIVYCNQHFLSIIKPLFSVMQLNECFGHIGPLISTSIDTALFMERVCNQAQKFFYVWDLEFLRHNTYSYALWAQQEKNYPINEKFFREIYHKYYLIARCLDHKKVLENNYNLKCDAIIPDFQLGRFLAEI